MGWNWCEGITSWISDAIPVPVGWTYPASGTNIPDLSTLLAPLGVDGEIDLFDRAGSFLPCDWDYTGLWASYGSSNTWTAGHGIPADTHMFVVASGPDYADTDPEPTWDPAWALTGPPAPVVEVIVVDTEGTPYGTLSDAARVAPIVLELNAAGTATIALPTTHADGELLLPGREVQVYLHGELVLWGPIVRPQGKLRDSTWQCAGAFWYFNHRFMGRADRVNLLTNGGFESGETGWTFSGGVTHSVETGQVYDSAQSLQLEGGTADHDSYATQTYTHTTQWHPLGDFITLSAYVYVVLADYLGGAIDDRGLMIVHRNAGGDALNYAVAEIGDATANDVWIPLEVGVPSVKAGDTIQVLLYPPHGVAYWDLVTLTLMESLGFENADVADVVEGIVLYAQDLNIFTHGKSDLNIVVDATATGVTKSIAYQFAEHRNIGDALMEYVRQGIVDIDIVYTPTTRTLTTYTPKGTLFGTTLELDTNLADFTYSWDGDRAAGSVVVLGPGDGPDRPEGGATDPAFLDGITLEIVESAEDDTTVGELDQQAADTLAVAKNPTILEVVTLPGAGIIGALHTGDTVPVLIDHGWVDVDAVYRVVRISIDPYMDQATITLNVT